MLLPFAGLTCNTSTKILKLTSCPSPGCCSCSHVPDHQRFIVAVFHFVPMQHQWDKAREISMSINKNLQQYAQLNQKASSQDSQLAEIIKGCCSILGSRGDVSLLQQVYELWVVRPNSRPEFFQPLQASVMNMTLLSILYCPSTILLQQIAALQKGVKYASQSISIPLSRALHTHIQLWHVQNQAWKQTHRTPAKTATAVLDIAA